MKTPQRLMVLLLAALMLAAPVHADYADVPQTTWAYEIINRATEQKLVEGVGADCFGYGRGITVAEFSMMLCRLMDWELQSPAKGSFADNQDTQSWYYSAIETAYANGALRKLGENVGVNGSLEREEMAAMTVRAIGYATLSGMVQDDCPFDDVTTNPGYIALAYHMGIMNGMTATQFSPTATATREQAVAVLLRVYDRIHGAQVKTHRGAAPADAFTAAPLSDTSGRIPMAPRAPLSSVYEAAVKAGEGGAVALHTAPFNATTGKAISQGELETMLASASTRTYHSARYGSSYLVHSERGSSIVVWYETDDDISEKLTLCCLMGVGSVYLTD